MRNNTSTKPATRTARASRAKAPETVVIAGAEVLAGTDPAEVEEAHTATVAVVHSPATGLVVAEPTNTKAPAKKAAETAKKGAKEPVTPSTTRKPTSRELAMQALDAFNEKAIANQTRTRPLVFANHVLGNLADSGKAIFAVLDGDTKLRMDVRTVEGGGAEVVEVYPVPVKAPKAAEAAQDSETPVSE